MATKARRAVFGHVDLLSLIFGYGTVLDLAAAVRVNRQLNRVASKPALWRHLDLSTRPETSSHHISVQLMTLVDRIETVVLDGCVHVDVGVFAVLGLLATPTPPYRRLRHLSLRRIPFLATDNGLEWLQRLVDGLCAVCRSRRADVPLRLWISGTVFDAAMRDPSRLARTIRPHRMSINAFRPAARPQQSVLVRKCGRLGCGHRQPRPLISVCDLCGYALCDRCVKQAGQAVTNMTYTCAACRRCFCASCGPRVASQMLRRCGWCTAHEPACSTRCSQQLACQVCKRAICQWCSLPANASGDGLRLCPRVVCVPPTLAAHAES